MTEPDAIRDRFVREFFGQTVQHRSLAMGEAAFDLRLGSHPGLVGGPVRIAETVVTYLRDAFTETEVSRLGGADRYETAALLADTTRSRVMLVDGRLDRIDSITAAATARLTDTTLLLSRRTCAPVSTRRLLEGRRVLTVGIVGTQSCS